MVPALQHAVYRTLNRVAIGNPRQTPMRLRSEGGSKVLQPRDYLKNGRLSMTTVEFVKSRITVSREATPITAIQFINRPRQTRFRPRGEVTCDER